MTNYVLPTVKHLKDVTENGKEKFNVISFFAGGGGSSTGYRMAGGKVLAINEFIPEAINTYRVNWPTTKIIEGDIKKITAQSVLDIAGIKKGELDLLDGSPPCSAFSTAGCRDKGWGKEKVYSDSKQENVEDLFFEYIRMIKGIMPRVFIAENVSGLAKGVAKGYLNKILRDMRECGYHVEVRLLDAKHLGVPQSRSRTIFVGVRNDLWKDEYSKNLHPKPLKDMVSLRKAFEGLVFTEQDEIETDVSKYSIFSQLKTLVPGTSHKKRFSLKKANPNSYCQTITAKAGNIGAAKAMHWNDRAFTVNEIKRIMSIPDDYILTGTYQQQVERLGRMVAPLMYKHVCENLLKIGVL